MDEFLMKVPHGWWKLFRTRCMAELHWTQDQWQNRYTNRTPLNPAEKIAMQKIYNQIKTEMRTK